MSIPKKKVYVLVPTLISKGHREDNFLTVYI